ncbi:hypothetical protein JOB18_048049, partial [Solea senegalensis]
MVYSNDAIVTLRYQRCSQHDVKMSFTSTVTRVFADGVDKDGEEEEQIYFHYSSGQILPFKALRPSTNVYGT